jgi:arabinose-5-phosphate isomerase
MSKSPKPASPLFTARQVLRTEAAAISSLLRRLDGAFERAVAMLASTKGRVIVTGMGKSGLIAQKIAATFSSTGTPSFFLHPAEAIHGDLGKLVEGDLVLALSYSGETEELLRLLERIKRLGIPLIAMTGGLKSTLARAADVLLDVSIRREACPLNLAPTASTTASLALGDALAAALIEQKGFRENHFAELHPGGELGRRIRRVEQLMHPLKQFAVVSPATPMRRVIEKISRSVRPDGRSFGLATVVDRHKKLMGVITDGDIRRLIQQPTDFLSQTAGDCMTRKPATIEADKLAALALNVMEKRQITALPVVDKAGRLKGLLHLNDLWRTQMI